MHGPLAPEMYDTDRPVGSYWEASLPPEPPRPTLEGEADCDVAIIGAGYAGLNAALVLAKRGVSVTVLDAGRLGWSASGRSGGICGPGGDKLSERDLIRRYGREEVALYREAQTGAIDWVRTFAETHGLAEHICGRGEIEIAHSRGARKGLERLIAADPENHDPIPPSGRADCARHGGVLTRPAFGIHPLAYVRALARAAEAAGATIHEGASVRVLVREGTQHRLETAKGSLLADRLLIATNGFTPENLLPSLRGLAVPVISNIGVTRPLTEDERAEHPWLDHSPACDTRHMLSYFRILPDNRLLLGARGDVTGSEHNAPRMRAHIRRRIAAELPGFAGAEIEYFWRGPIAATMRLSPAVGWLDARARIALALGWHGSGIAMGSLGGRLAAETLLSGGEAHIPAPMKGMPRRVPLPSLRRYYVGAAMAAYRLSDTLSLLPMRRG